MQFKAAKKTAALALILLLVGCAPKPQPLGPTPSPTEKPLQKVTILLDWFPNTNHTGIYVAKEKGYYKQQGLDVEIIQPGENSNVDQIVASGKADFGISAQESVTQARVGGIPLVSIAAIIQHNTSAFASLKTAGINTAKDFEGKRYGGWGSPVEEAVIKGIMEKSNADFSKVKNVTIGTTDFFTTIGKESDFQWIFYGWDGIEAKRRGLELNTIMLADLDPIFDYYTPILITNEQHISEQKPLVKNFMKATADGYKFAISQPTEAADILSKAAPELNPELINASQQWVSSQYQDEALIWGLQYSEVWRRYAQWMADQKLIDHMIEPENAFTNEFVK
ncbi:MAG: ABC transporter substrate-binding protein [bacterium]